MGLFDTYKAAVDTEITTKTAPSSIDPADVGTKFKELCDLIEPGLTDINAFTASTVDPTGGSNGDVHIKTGINPFKVYQLIAGIWTLTGEMLFPALTFYTLTQTTPYYSAASGGSITIPNFATDYPTLSANGIVRMQGWITVDGTATGGTIAQSEVDLIPVVTRDASGNITAATFNFGIDGTITTFKLRMY